MKVATSKFWYENNHLFDEFDGAYLFGSILNTDQARDIDLILIYKGKYNAKLMYACYIMRVQIFEYFKRDVHLTVLSKSENNEVRFLSRVNSLQIKR